LRSTFLRVPFVVLALVGGSVAIACNSSFDGLGASSSPRGSDENAEAPTSGGTSYGSSDGSAAAPKRNLTSPLCGYAENVDCMPDDDGAGALRSGALRCATPQDGGLPAPDASTKTPGCRITEKQDGDGGVVGYAPKCTNDADRRGTDGVACQSGSDCAPGFDCVHGEKGPVCRRYCCSGSCEDHSSQSGGKTFCDIQELAEFGGHKVPVCMPLKTCELLRDGECGYDETCAIVTQKGETGCVPRGDAKVGDPCDEAHCDSNLTCLGSFGDRRCYKLCRMEGSECGAMQTCTSGSVFQDTAFGVCQDD